MLTPVDFLSLQAENKALREEIRQLRARQTVAKAQQHSSDEREQLQVRFRTVFENSPFGQKIITPDMIIRQVNPAVVQMLGCANEQDLVGRRILEFAHPDYQADWHFLQQRLWEHKLPYFTLETCLVRTDGSSFWCQVTSIRFPDGAEELGYTLLEDIGDRKALELSLKRLYDAQETILHLVTHELKTPIAHIQLLTDLLERQVAAPPTSPESEPDMRQYLALIRRACGEADKLFRDVLLLGSLEATQLHKQPTDLACLLRERLQAHRLVAHNKGINLELDMPAQIVQANLDVGAFGRVVDNLVSNALKFTPPSGRVTIGLREQAGKVTLKVADTGIGIPEHLQIKLFEKFSSAARPGLSGEASTGLGLFITKHIVQLHRGKIWVESREGAGACFFVELS